MKIKTFFYDFDFKEFWWMPIWNCLNTYKGFLIFIPITFAAFILSSKVSRQNCELDLTSSIAFQTNGTKEQITPGLDGFKMVNDKNILQKVNLHNKIYIPFAFIHRRNTDFFHLKVGERNRNCLKMSESNYFTNWVLFCTEIFLKEV